MGKIQKQCYSGVLRQGSSGKDLTNAKLLTDALMKLYENVLCTTLKVKWQ